MGRTKIIATIGPKTETADEMRRLVAMGADVFRLNGSHADLNWHRRTILKIQETCPLIPILLDIPGRKIRTTQLKRDLAFRAGEVVVLTTDGAYAGEEKAPVNYADLHLQLSAGDLIKADDGTLSFKVQKVVGRDIHCIADFGGTLKSRKGINVPFVKLNTPLVTARDHEMIAFCKELKVDFVGISFVESKAHVEAIRELIRGKERAESPRIVAKIESRGGVENMDEIIAATDVIMIDRGDLSVETDLVRTTLMQKKILQTAGKIGKPVIVATEMLHTMIHSPNPTKAEVSDITNAILDGAAATMLSGETAMGEFPFEAVKVMREISDATSAEMESAFVRGPGDALEVSQVMEDAIGMICRSLPITKIVAITRSGFAARMVSMRKPAQPILAVSNDAVAAKSFNILPGTEGVYVDVPFSRDSLDHLPLCLEKLWTSGKLIPEDLILITALTYPHSGNRMNTVLIHRVSDLQKTFSEKSKH